jgi:hypothetical protein
MARLHGEGREQTFDSGLLWAERWKLRMWGTASVWKGANTGYGERSALMWCLRRSQVIPRNT